jgi:hypothetical protein
MAGRFESCWSKGVGVRLTSCLGALKRRPYTVGGVMAQPRACRRRAERAPPLQH